MKNKIVAFLFLALLSTSAIACDAEKAIVSLGGLNLTLQPGVPQVITFDFSDCSVGVANDSLYVAKPTRSPLPINTPLTVTLYDVTTGQYYAGGQFVFYCINNCQSVCGHVLQMTLTLSPSAHKPLAVNVSQTNDLGGPCQ